MLFGYFDESGTDNLLGHTVVSGLVGKVSEWAALDPPWRAELMRARVPCFHYVDAKGRNKDYRHFVKDEWKEHVGIMANIVAERHLQLVAGAFSGDWNRCVSDNEEWQARFPSAYHFCFELVIEKLRRVSEFYGGEPITVIMSNQNQFSQRALKIWDYFHYNNAWKHIAHVGYSCPQTLTQLQAADAVAYETRRGLWKGTDEHWQNELPVTSRLLAKHQERRDVVFDNGYSEQQLLNEMQKPKGTYLKVPPKYRKGDGEEA